MKKRTLLALAGVMALAASVAAAQQDRPADEAEAAAVQPEAEVVEVAVETVEKRSDEDAIAHAREAFFIRQEERMRAQPERPQPPARVQPGLYRHVW